MAKKIEDLRETLFDTIEGIKTGKVDVEKAKAITNIAQVIVNSAKAEIDFLRNVNQFKINLHLVGVGYDGLYIQNELPINVYSMSYNLNGISFLKSQKYTGWMVPSGRNKSFRNG